MPRIYFLTHPQVVIDPAVPVPRWPLSEVGRRRAHLFADSLVDGAVTAVWSSSERKASCSWGEKPTAISNAKIERPAISASSAGVGSVPGAGAIET